MAFRGEVIWPEGSALCLGGLHKLGTFTSAINLNAHWALAPDSMEPLRRRRACNFTPLNSRRRFVRSKAILESDAKSVFGYGNFESFPRSLGTDDVQYLKGILGWLQCQTGKARFSDVFEGNPSAAAIVVVLERKRAL